MFHKVMATVLFVHNLDACKAFYRDTLGLPMQESDANSAGFQLENIYLILLKASAGAAMISEQPLDMTFAGGPRSLLAAGVDDVDATYAALKAKGVAMLKPPTDQPWGLRTAYFADPEGHVWEINQPA